jgi:hypothetical protein
MPYAPQGVKELDDDDDDSCSDYIRTIIYFSFSVIS